MPKISSSDYRALAAFRYEIRKVLAFSEQAARDAGIEPQQHQLLLAVRGLPEGARPTIGTIAGGALAPFIATALFNVAGNSSLITVYATAVALVSWLSVLGLQETYQRDLSAT